MLDIRRLAPTNSMDGLNHAWRRNNGSSKTGLRISSHSRPRPGRRRASISSAKLHFLLSISLLLFAAYIPSMTTAAPAPAGEAPPLPPVPGNPSFHSRWTPAGEIPDEILFDHSEAPGSGLYPEIELLKRQIDFGSSSSSAKADASTKAPASTAAQKPSASSTDVSSPTTTDSGSGGGSSTSSTSSPMPKPFDGGLGTNFTQPSCPNFLSNMINNETFTSCLPFSVLLQNSMSFFDASRSVGSITQVLTASCNVVSPTCSALMSSFAINIRSPSYCSDDYNRQNPIVRQAYNGLLAYDVLYRASCLHAQPTASNNQSSDYCFADAVTNTTAPTDSYIYYLPLGIPLPAGTQPTCDQCLKDTMAVFETQAGNQSQPVSFTYAQGAQLINQQCGPNFVNQSVPSGGSGSGKSSSASSLRKGVSGYIGAITVALVGVSWLLL